MDNEMKNGMRELGMDEMDKVSGGADGGYFAGQYRTEKEIYDMGMALLNSFPYDIAGDAFCEMAGISKQEAIHFGKTKSTDKDRMSCLIHRYMQILDGLEANDGHTY